METMEVFLVGVKAHSAHTGTTEASRAEDKALSVLMEVMAVFRVEVKALNVLTVAMAVFRVER